MTRAKVMAQVIALALFVAAGGGAAGAADLLASLHNAGVQGDCARAQALVGEIEAAGEPEALVALAARFEEGRPCLEPDPARAAGLFRRAAEAGEAAAMARLGRLHVGGRGVPQDRARAEHWFRAAVLALVGVDAVRRRELLALALDGEVPDLLARQLVWLGLIERGGPKSRFDLAMRLRIDDSVPRHQAAAEKLLEDAALGGLVEAQYELGLWQLQRAKETGFKQASSVRYLMIAAERGHAPAQAALGEYLAHGDRRDKNLAYLWLLRAQSGKVDVADLLFELERVLSPAEVAAARAIAAEPAAATDE